MPDAADLRVLIVDDEPLAAGRLLHLCGRLVGVKVIAVESDGRTALAKTDALVPDVLLVDIAMPGLDGVALARALAARDDAPSIVFVTASSNFAVTAFELAAIDYLLKPVSLERLDQAMARVRETHEYRSAVSTGYLREIWAPRGRDVTRLGIETLDMIEAERDYVRLHAVGQAYLLRTTLQELERRLDPEHFIRVHRSTIVSRSRISALRSDPGGSWAVLLSTGQSVKIGRSFRRLVRNSIGEPR